MRLTALWLWWDNPTVSTSKVDSKKRIVLPQGRPGEIFHIEEQAEGRILLVRLEKPEPPPEMTRETCLSAMDEHPLLPTLTWEQLRKLTRE